MFKLNNRYLQEMAEGGEVEAQPQAEQPESLINPEQQPVERPEFLKEKYKTIEDQAKAYVELEKKLGAHTGAPESYELPEGLTEDSELVKAAIETAKELGINQQAFDKMLELATVNSQVTQEVSQQVEMEKLGEKAGERLQAVENFLTNKFEGDSEGFEKVKNLVTTAESVQIIEALMSAGKPAGLPTETDGAGQSFSKEDYFSEMYKTDDKGNLLVDTDSRHREKVEAMRRKLYQSG